MRAASGDGARWRRSLATAAARETLDLVVCAAAVATVVVVAPAVRQQGGGEHLHLVLTLVAAAVGAATAILGDVAARLSDDAQAAWLASAFAVYGLVVVPSTILWPTAEGLGVVALTSRLAGFMIIFVLLVVASRPPAGWSPWTAWAAAAAGVLVALAAGQLAAAFPGPAGALTSPAVPAAATLLACSAVATWILLVGTRRGRQHLAQIGLGLLLLAGAHLYRLATGLTAFQPDLVFDGVRLVALLVALVGMLRLTAHAVRTVRSERLLHQEELRIAAVHMQRAADQAAERDHELRNGLLGLSGVTAVLSATGPEQERLRSAVLRELARLSAMIDRADPGRTEQGYDVEPVLRDIVAVRRSAGESITLETVPGVLRAEGTAAVLAQAVTNLLANCARHSPGAPVQVRAGPCGRRVIIEVHDGGRGRPAGPPSDHPGTRCPESGYRRAGSRPARQPAAARR